MPAIFDHEHAHATESARLTRVALLTICALSTLASALLFLSAAAAGDYDLGAACGVMAGAAAFFALVAGGTSSA